MERQKLKPDQKLVRSQESQLLCVLRACLADLSAEAQRAKAEAAKLRRQAPFVGFVFQSFLDRPVHAGRRRDRSPAFLKNRTNKLMKPGKQKQEQWVGEVSVGGG